MKLSSLIKGFPAARIVGPFGEAEAEPKLEGNPRAAGRTIRDPEISSVHYRAQDVRPGGVFAAIPGMKADGHDFIDLAVEKGAAAVVALKPARTAAVTVVVDDTRKALAFLSARFYGNPSEKLAMVGITGTNGKTTTSYLVESILEAAGYKVGVIGTINYRFGGKVFGNPTTTPESLDLQRILAEMAAEKVTHAVMEVSSHAIDLNRIDHCWMDVGVFTNLTQDHLDYHGDMETYWACKRKFFTEHLVSGPKKDRAKAVVNCDDSRGRLLFAEFPLNGLSVGKSPLDMVRARNAEMDATGTKCVVATPYGEFEIESGLAGEYNVENILAAVGVGVSLNLPMDAMKKGVENLKSVPGRLERVPNDMGRNVYVDYAHTPDALENVLKSLKSLTPKRLICVFGCGGDRDKGKRPLMGGIAAKWCDLCFVTSDNPRSESPLEIIEQILEGVREGGGKSHTVSEVAAGLVEKGYAVEPDRRNAIRLAVRTSLPGDTVLIAGKGHEAYQIVGGKTLPFDDRLEAKMVLSM